MDDEGDDASIAARVARRKRRWCLMGARAGQEDEALSSQQQVSQGSTTRRRLVASATNLTSPKKERDIEVIKNKLGNCQHHGTGNPLAVRSPSMPKTLAVDNLAKIIQEGVLGQAIDESIPKLKTERGSGGSFWTNRLRLAGGYGWTGLILPSDVDSSKPLPIVDNVIWFVVENQEELQYLKQLLQDDMEKWEAVQDRVVTVAQLAQRLSGKRRQST